jgi:hypothetical protein
VDRVCGERLLTEGYGRPRRNRYGGDEHRRRASATSIGDEHRRRASATSIGAEPSSKKGECAKKSSRTDLIDREELKEKLDRGHDFRLLVMALGEWAYRSKHIPDSLRIGTVKEALETPDPHDEIVF